MSKTSWWLLCALLLLLQVLAARLPPLAAGHRTGDRFSRQDPIRGPRPMPSHARDQLGCCSADSILDDDDNECAADEDDGVSVVTAGEAAGLEEGLLLPNDDGGEEEEEAPPPPVDGDDGDSGGGAKGSSSGSGGGGGGDVECPECGKFFKNDKSMFGHLRSHPDRGYKGATPPAKKPKLPPGTAAAASPPVVIDGPPAQHSGRDPRLTPFEKLCAYAMATLTYRCSQAMHTPPLPSFKLGAFEQALAEGGAVLTNREQRADAAEQVTIKAEVQEDDTAALPTVRIPKKRRNMPKEAGEAPRRKVRIVLAAAPKEKRPYMCKHCGAEFVTHQALGGHMAGHHRDKKEIKGTPRAQPGAAGQSQSGMMMPATAGGSDDGGVALQGGLLLAGEHPSMAMDRPWQSGPASGGHFRQQHFERGNDGMSPAAAAAPTADAGGLSPVAPAAPAAAGADGRRLFNVDLNVEAPEQE